MNRQIVNQTCYQKNQQNLQEQRRQTYLKNKQQPKTNTKSNLANYYHANNIKVLITLKDYIESSPEKMKF
jgi:beta-lactamase class A